MNINDIVWILLLLPLTVSMVNRFVLNRFGIICGLLSTLSTLSLFILTLFLRYNLDSLNKINSFTWLNIPGFKVNISLLLDNHSINMMLIVALVGLLVNLFSISYMEKDLRISQYFSALSLFMFSMIGIVLSNNFVMMFIFWELVGVTSYILIGHWFTKDSAANAANKAFLSNRIGDFGFLIGILIIWIITGSFYFEDIQKFDHSKSNLMFINIGVICLFCGAIGKSAQFPLHTWLPDAMEGPTPVSALIHAATMVAAGVFMLARIFFLIEISEIASNVIIWTGVITSFIAAVIALQQNDIKKILAYSTLSQLGYMVFAQGMGAEGSDAGMFHLYTHAFFKALLFLCAGAVIFSCHHEQNIWKMGGLCKKMPITFICFLTAYLAIIAFPLTSGFWSKEHILDIALKKDYIVPYIIGIVVSFLTTLYMTRLVVVVFLGKPKSKNSENSHEVSYLMLIPLIVLSFLSVFSAYKPLSEFFLARGKADIQHLISHIGITFILSMLTLTAGFITGFLIYNKRKNEVINIKLIKNKFYFDELYKLIVLFFQDIISKVFSIFDKHVINKLFIKIPCSISIFTGSIVRYIQTGVVTNYVLFFGISFILILLYFIL